MTVFFTSDTHFGHAGVLGLYKRPFASVAAMDAALVERWNAVVGPGDEVWHLGDFALAGGIARAGTLLAALNGRKHLIAGNNDPERVRREPGWASVADYGELELDGVKLVLCHYPFRSWNGMAQGALDLHGHSHGRLAPQTRQIDVGVDAWDFKPVTLAALRARRRPRRPDSAAPPARRRPEG